MMSDWLIGTVEFVSPKIMKFSTSLIDLDTHIKDGNLLVLHGINDFIYVKNSFNELNIFKVLKIKNNVYDKSIEPNLIPQYNQILFSAVPIGVLYKNNFKAGFNRYPLVGDKVYGMSTGMVQKLFSEHRNSIIIGRLSNYSEVKPRLNLDSIFTKHWAILGNTGSGKSTTLRKILNELQAKQNLIKDNVHFYVFDLHGDYSNLSFGEKINISDMHLPLKKLSLDDWTAALLPSDRTQKPLLERVLKISGVPDENYNLLYALLALRAVKDSSQDAFAMLKRNVQKLIEMINDNTLVSLMNKWNLIYGNENNREEIINEIQDYIKGLNKSEELTIDEIITKESEDSYTLQKMEKAFELAVIEEEISGNRNIRQNIQTMYSRFKSLKLKYENNILGKNGNVISIDEIIDRAESPFIILDVTGLDDDILKLISNYLVNSLFEEHMDIGLKDNTSKIFSYVFLDEAHRYISYNNAQETTIFDKIAREGRKFNLYLCILSQIPSELSKVVLSQCGVYMLHRIQNANDINFIANNVPAASQDILDRLPSMPAGTAILSGSGIDFPIEINVEGEGVTEISKSESPFKQ